MRVIIALWLVLFSFQSTALADVSSYVDSLISKVSTMLSDPNTSESGKISSSRSLLAQNLDFNTMSKNALGRHYETLTAEQKNTFVAAYKEYLINTYSSMVKKYRGQVAKVKNVKPIGNDYIVQTLVEQNGQNPIKADYYVRSVGGSYKIADIITEGVSLIATHKAEFCEIFANKGFDGLLNAIKSKH